MTNKAHKIYIVYPTLILSTTSIEARVCIYIYIYIKTDGKIFFQIYYE